MAEFITDSTKVAVLKGGTSAEREVSLRSAARVASALRDAHFQVVEIDTQEPAFIDTLRIEAPDVVFIALHGRFGEDGTVQGLCELLGLPYVGSGVLASALAIDKVMSKHCFAHHGLRTPPYMIAESDERFQREAFLEEVRTRFSDKVVIKPAREGSSLGMSIISVNDDLGEALDKAFTYDSCVLVEQFIAGMEITVGVLGNRHPKALPTIEIVSEREFYDYESKYETGMSHHIIPARLSSDVNEACSRLAEDAHRVLGCRGFSRSDFIVDETGDAWLLETNTLPGMTEVSLVPDAAEYAGIEFPELCEMLVAFAFEK